jgi:hypothetical protein
MKAWDAYRPKEFGMGVRDFFLIFNVKLRVVIFPVKKIRGQGQGPMIMTQTGRIQVRNCS